MRFLMMQLSLQTTALFHPEVSFWRMCLLIQKALELDQMEGIDVRIQNSLKALLKSNLFFLSFNFQFCISVLFTCLISDEMLHNV